MGRHKEQDVSQHFDVVVIGMHRAGLIAAALLAKRGARVLLVDNGESCATYRRRGLRLPLVPTLVPVLDQAPHPRRVVEELALGPHLRTHVSPLHPAFQGILPGHRVDIAGEQSVTIDELVTEFPDLEEPIRDFFRKLSRLDQDLTRVLDEDPPLPPGNFRERLRGRSLVARAPQIAAPFTDEDLLTGIPKGHPLRDLFLAPLALFGHLAADPPSVFHAVRLLARYFGGTVGYPDRIGGLTTLLLGAARDAGVEIHRGAVVKELTLVGRRIDQMEIEDDRLVYNAALFVANTVGPFGDLLPPGKQHARFTAEQQTMRPVATLLTLNLVVERRVIPVGMGEALFLLDGRRLPREGQPEDPPVFLRRYPAQSIDPEARARPILDAAGDECEVLSAACPAPRADVLRSPERLAALRELLYERVRRVVPFLDDSLTDRSMAMDTAGWDIEAQNRRADPLGAHPFFSHHGTPFFGIGGRPPRTCFKNLVHCGPDVVPGLGVEGDFIGGLAAAQAANKLAGGRWRPR